MGDRKLLIPASGRARVLFATICAIGSVGGIIAALGYELKLTLSLPAVQEWPANFAVVRVEDDTCGTVSTDGTKLTVDRWTSGGKAAAKSWSVDTGKSRTAWAADPVGGWVAWSSGTRISVVQAPLDDRTQPAAKTLDTGGKTPVTLSALPDRTLAVVLTGGSIQRWDVNSMSLASDQKIPFGAGDQALFDGDWLGIWRVRRQEVATFSLSDDGEWASKGVMPLPAGARPVMNAYGSVAAIVKNGVWYGGVTYEAPGQVRSVALRRFGGILVTGDFEGLYLLHPDRPAEKLVNAEPRSALTFTGGKLAIAGSRGAALYNVRGAQLFTDRGRTLIYAAGVLFAALGIYMLALFGRLAWKHIVRIGSRIPSGFGGEFAKRSTAPPPALIEALNGKQAILWAGSGLSAQAGHPTWSDLLERMHKTATVENWFSKETLRALDVARRTGDDRVLEEIVQGMSNRRSRMVEFICNIFSLPAQLSKSHYALYRMPFRACITTNYDNMLERLGPDWNARLYTARSQGFARAAESPKFFLMKLYGDLRDPDTILLCPSELYASAEEWPSLGDTLRTLFKENSFFFVGVSPERLLADLRSLNMPQSSQVRHWIASGVAGSKWSRAAQDLKDEFGVQLIPFRSTNVDLELPLWLDQVSQQFSPSRVSNRPADPWYVETRAS